MKTCSSRRPAKSWDQGSIGLVVSRRWTPCVRSRTGERSTRRRPSCGPASRSRGTATTSTSFRWASVTKPVTALATLVAAEEGALDLDEPAGPAGLDRQAPARARFRPSLHRAKADRAGRGSGGSTPTPASRCWPPTWARARRWRSRDYLSAAVLEPLGMNAELRGSPAADLHGTLDDLILLARRTARAERCRAGDAGRGDGRRLSRAVRSPARLRPLRAERLGPRLRAQGREGAALDGHAQLAADLRPLRRLGDVPLGRPGPAARARAASPTASSDRGQRTRGRVYPTPSSRARYKAAPWSVSSPSEPSSSSSTARRVRTPWRSPARSSSSSSASLTPPT